MTNRTVSPTTRCHRLVELEYRYAGNPDQTYNFRGVVLNATEQQAIDFVRARAGIIPTPDTIRVNENKQSLFYRDDTRDEELFLLQQNQDGTPSTAEPYKADRVFEMYEILEWAPPVVEGLDFPVYSLDNAQPMAWNLSDMLCDTLVRAAASRTYR